jgi:hypothetical protein
MSGKARRLILVLIAACPLLAAAGAAPWRQGREACASPAPAAQHSAPAGRFAEVRLQPVVERGMLTARVGYHFSAVALEAMQKGLPLQVLFEVRRVRPRIAGFDETVARAASRRHIQYHPLSQQYLLRDLASGRRSTHLTLPLAIEALGLYEQLDLPPVPGTRLEARTRLDLETLPAPMRPLAYISSDWNLDSGWLPLEAGP